MNYNNTTHEVKEFMTDFFMDLKSKFSTDSSTVVEMITDKTVLVSIKDYRFTFIIHKDIDMDPSLQCKAYCIASDGRTCGFYQNTIVLSAALYYKLHKEQINAQIDKMMCIIKEYSTN